MSISRCLEVMALLLLPLAAACETPPRTPEERTAYSRRRYQQAVKDAERRRPDAAIDALREAVKYDQQLFEAHQLLGKLLYFKGETFDKASDKLDQDARAAEARGEMVQAGEARKQAVEAKRHAAVYYSEAIRSLEIYNEHTPGDPEINLMVGFIFLTRDEIELAMQSFAAGYRSGESSPKWKRKFEDALRLCQERLSGTKN